MSLAEFDALDALDADAVLLAGRVIDSENKTIDMTQRAMLAALNRQQASKVNRELSAEKKFRDSVTGGTDRINTPPGPVIVH